MKTKKTKRPAPSVKQRPRKTALLLVVKTDLKAGFNPQPEPPGD